MKDRLRKEIGADGQKTVTIEGTVDAEMAWEVVKWLEGLGEEDYPLILDLSRAESVHWLATGILDTAVQSLSGKKGAVYLKYGSTIMLPPGSDG